MTITKPLSIFIVLIALFTTNVVKAQTLLDNDQNMFKVSGYLRTGLGYSEGGETQAHFQVPGALNKYSLGNQADTYGELEFDYTYYLNDDKTKSIDAVWMTSMYEDFGTENNMSFNFTEQLYLRVNNLLGFNESIWVGNRFYDRRAIHMLDRQWINPGQKGWGAGVENLLNSDGDEDIKVGVWQFKDRDVKSYGNGLIGDLTNYTVDARLVNKPIAETVNINFALNYSIRTQNEALGYSREDGYGAFLWTDYKKESITNTTALLYRQGANVSVDHWSGTSVRENPLGDNLVLNNLSKGYSFEVNNDFLYDDKDKFAINAIFMFVARNYGTTPYYVENNTPVYQLDKGNMFYWVSGAARAMYYVTDKLRPTLEYSYEYGNNEQLGVKGNLNKITFTPELTLKKGYYYRPVVRPFVSYAFWSDGFKGLVGTTPNGAPFADKNSGFTYGVQFEIWW